MPRIVDLLLLAAIAPFAIAIAVIVACIVYVSFGSPVFFTQARGGYANSTFRLYKFRTMTNERDANGDLLPDGDRLTRVGRFLRATSLDELPSLWNLLKGDIRLVGPRPLIADYLPLYNAEQKRRHQVAPGITGWAQVNGRNSLSWEDKFALDIWYVENRSFWLDLKILSMTAKSVLGRHGINARGESTMSRFMGSKIE